MSDANGSQTVAGIDLGSNSFHMIVARVADERLQVVDRLRERVRLAAGLDEKGDLSAEKREQALACLARFGERIRGLERNCVRAVGTNTFRHTRDTSFLSDSEKALGHPIEIVSGAEEARLVYLGVAHSISTNSGQRLVLDIGGGSTECIVGEQFEPIVADSLELGCVTFSMRFFPGGKLSAECFQRAELAASLEFQRVRQHYLASGWHDAVGSSGTIHAVERILRESELSTRGIDLAGLEALRARMIEAGSTDNLKLAGLEEDRRTVLAGGLSILLAAFRILDIDNMIASRGALREGLLYDLLGRIQHEDRREQTIATFQERFSVDVQHAASVEMTALTLLASARRCWNLPREESRALLSWAARLHEIGTWISFARHHRHGSYLLENADMAGFSRLDQRILAALVREHRRKIVRSSFEHLPSDHADLAMRLCVLLRLAVRLSRSRREQPLPDGAEFEVEDCRLMLRLPDDWLNDRPLVQEDLKRESNYLPAIGFELVVA